MEGPKGGRRSFTLRAVLALLGGATISIWGCREGAPTSGAVVGPAPTLPPPTPTPTPVADETGVFLANHGHEALIAGAALVAGNAVRLDIRGTANHPHTLELSAEEIVAIAAGLRVGKESSEEKGHTHYVIFN